MFVPLVLCTLEESQNVNGGGFESRSLPNLWRLEKLRTRKLLWDQLTLNHTRFVTVYTPRIVVDLGWSLGPSLRLDKADIAAALEPGNADF